MKPKSKRNPHLAKATRVRFDLRDHRKMYVPAFSYLGATVHIGRKAYKTADLAQRRSQDVIDRWRRLYDASQGGGQ